MSDPKFFAEIVGTTNRNFLLLCSEETTFEDPLKVDTKMEKINKDMQAEVQNAYEVYDRTVESGQMPKEVAGYIKAKVLETERQRYGSDFWTIYYTYYVTGIIAREHKLGFYVSKRNGRFERYTDTMLSDLVADHDALINELFDAIETSDKSI